VLFQSDELASQAVQQFSANLFATPTGLAARPAVCMHLRVPLTLFTTAPTDCHASLHQWHADVGVIDRSTPQDPDGGTANIVAVQTKPDAFDHLAYAGFAQVIFAIGRACIDALLEGTDACREQGVIHNHVARVVIHRPLQLTHVAPLGYSRLEMEFVTGGVPFIGRRLFLESPANPEAAKAP
jgi:hypothetical protein